MEIEENIYQQYRDTPYKFQESSKNHENSEQNEENIGNSKKLDAYNIFLNNIKESINEPKGRRISDNITLRVSIDKKRQDNHQESFSINCNNSLDKDNKDKHKSSLDNKDKRKNIAYVNNLYKEEIEYENNDLNFNKNQIMNNNNDNKVFLNNNNFCGPNNYKNNNNYIENEKHNKFSYNPFIQKNEVGNGKGSQINYLNTQNNINYDKELKTIDQKLREEPIDKNNPNYLLQKDYDKINNEPINAENVINNSKGKKDILITGSDSLDEEIMKYNFVLSSIPVKEKKTDDKDIAKLKKDLQGEKKQLNNDNLNLNQQNKNIQNNAEFIESQNIYGNLDENNDDKNKKFFYLKAEPIENDIQKNNLDEENNLATSSEIIDIDKNSEYTIKTGTNFDQIVRKKSKLYPILLAILLGSAGLLFLLYTSKAIRNILLNLLKMIPGFFGALFGSFGKEILDFLEKYNDSYRFLGDLVMIIIFWIILRFFIKCVAKYIKTKHK